MFTFDSASTVAIVGLLSVVFGGLVTGFWPWLMGRGKAASESKKADVDAQASVMNGFLLLFEEFKKERAELNRRVIELMERQDELEAEVHKNLRRIMVLEQIIVKNALAVPPDEGAKG